MKKFFVGEKNHFHINLEDEVVRGSIILHEGKLLWPPPPPPAPAPTPAAVAKPEAEKPAALAPVEPNYFNNTLKDAALLTGGMISRPKTFFGGRHNEI